jgi:hypothetical protein
MDSNSDLKTGNGTVEFKLPLDRSPKSHLAAIWMSRELSQLENATQFFRNFSYGCRDYTQFTEGFQREAWMGHPV